MDPTSDHIISLTEQVWESIIGLPLLPEAPAPAESDLAVSSCVQITGGWEGTVVVRSSRALARTITETMFGMDDGEAAQEDIDDAIGEVANMIGGNVKSLVPGPSLLSLPAVVVGEPMVFPRSEECALATFLVSDQPFQVSVLRRSSGAESSEVHLAHASV